MTNRPPIPESISRAILIESGHKCAVCGESTPLERAHIIPWSKSKKHTAENLICLCANCHGRADREKWGQKTLKEYKETPWILRRKDVVEPSQDTTSTIAPSGEGKTKLYGVPRGTASFVGREPDLEALAELLDGGDDIGVSASIHGLAGIGKTELAIRLARTLASAGKFPGGFYWLDAEEPDVLGGWDAIGEELGMPGGPDRAALALRAVSGQSRNCLLILDNVTSWKCEQRPKPLPSGEHVQLLATTRRSSLGMGFKHHPVQVLPENVARGLLVKLEVDPASDGFEELLRYLDGHALALELAGCYLREFGEESPRSYLERLIAGEDPGEKVVSDLGRYEWTVRQSLQLLWDRLDSKTQHHWRVMAQLAPAPASPSLLDACGLDQDSRHTLGKFSLIDETGDGRKKMHRLVQAFGRRGDTTKAERAFFKGCCSRASTIELSTGYEVYLEDAPHLAKAIKGGERGEWGEVESLIALLEGTGTGLQSAGRYSESRNLLEKALSLALRHFGEEHPGLSALRTSLGLVLRALGEFEEAKEHLELTLESDLKNLGPNHPNVSVSRSNLSVVLTDIGNLSEARVHLELALESLLKKFGPDHPDIGIGRSNLATVLQDLGDFKEAKAHFELALKSNLKNFGSDHPDVSVNRSNLATAFMALRDFDEAKAHLEPALESLLRSLGPDHPKVSVGRSNLGLVLRGLGDFNGANALLELALESDLKNLGSDHPSVATRRFNLAMVLQELGDLAGAREQAKEARRVVLLQPEGTRVRDEVLRALSRLNLQA